MHCVCQTGMRKSLTCPVVSVAAWHFAACCSKNQTCCCSTNQRTTWMLNPWHGSSASCTTLKAPLWQLPTTVTSSTTLQAGFWNLTAVKVSRGKVTILPGLSRKMLVWLRKPQRKRLAVNPLRRNWSGFVRALKAASLKARPVWLALKN
ncbi:hypothetical protein D3C75_769930 [compost metagenome]